MPRLEGPLASDSSSSSLSELLPPSPSTPGSPRRPAERPSVLRTALPAPQPLRPPPIGTCSVPARCLGRATQTPHPEIRPRPKGPPGGAAWEPVVGLLQVHGSGRPAPQARFCRPHALPSTGCSRGRSHRTRACCSPPLTPPPRVGPRSGKAQCPLVHLSVHPFACDRGRRRAAAVAGAGLRWGWGRCPRVGRGERADPVQPRPAPEPSQSPAEPGRSPSRSRRSPNSGPRARAAPEPQPVSPAGTAEVWGAG